MLRIKDSVDLAGVQPEMLLAAHVTDQVYIWYGVPYCWITSCKDSTHRAGSLHYVGLALDFRINNIPTASSNPLPEIVKDIAAHLGPQYDVVLESDHIHIEYQPKQRSL